MIWLKSDKRTFTEEQLNLLIKEKVIIGYADFPLPNPARWVVHVKDSDKRRIFRAMEKLYISAKWK